MDLVPTGCEGLGDRRAAVRLRTDEFHRLVLDEARGHQLLEAKRDLRVQAPRGDGRDDHIGQAPAELLGDLERERLAALRVERPEVDVDEGPALLIGDFKTQAVDVVVRAFNGDDGRAVAQGVIDLGRLEACRNEDHGAEPESRGGRGRRAGEVAGRGTGEGVEAERHGPRGRNRHDAILERQRRVARVVLEIQAPARQTDVRTEPVGADQGRRTDREPAIRGLVHRQQLEVAPDPGSSRLDRGTTDLRPDRFPVVHDLEPTEAGRTDEIRSDRLGPVAILAAEAGDPRSNRGVGRDNRRGHHRPSGGSGEAGDRVGHGRLLVGGTLRTRWAGRPWGDWAAYRPDPE